MRHSWVYPDAGGNGCAGWPGPSWTRGSLACLRIGRDLNETVAAGVCRWSRDRRWARRCLILAGEDRLSTTVTSRSVPDRCRFLRPRRLHRKGRACGRSLSAASLGMPSSLVPPRWLGVQPHRIASARFVVPAATFGVGLALIIPAVSGRPGRWFQARPSGGGRLRRRGGARSLRWSRRCAGGRCRRSRRRLRRPRSSASGSRTTG